MRQVCAVENVQEKLSLNLMEEDPCVRSRVGCEAKGKEVKSLCLTN
jgi:hypothetical protein